MKRKIEKVQARKISDSRGNPTVEVVLTVDSKEFKASVPSGASVGTYEAVELRDNDGGVSKAIENILEIIGPKIVGRNVVAQAELDRFMIQLDGTDNKSNLGANTICPVSLAICRAGAAVKELELFQHIKEVSGFSISVPRASFNIINGGQHAENELDIQEFMFVSLKNSFSGQLKEVKETYSQLKKIIVNKHGKDNLNLGDEGGFAPNISKSEEALNLILEAAEDKKINIVLDVAASEFFKNGKYTIEGESLNKKGLLDYYSKLIDDYPILAIEDPFAENDWAGFKMITKSFGDKISIIGDDLLVTNSQRIKKAEKEGAVNAALLKINQIGTVTEALEYAKLARDFGWKIMVSHRSGETMDDFIADFSVGIGADFIKSGAPSQKERMVKYNRLLEIEKELK